VPLQTLGTVRHDVPRDREDGHGPQLVALDDRHTLQIDVAPADAKGFSDAHPGTEHEGDEVFASSVKRLSSWGTVHSRRRHCPIAGRITELSRWR
jgi:hypothetical protein